MCADGILRAIVDSTLIVVQNVHGSVHGNLSIELKSIVNKISETVFGYFFTIQLRFPNRH